MLTPRRIVASRILVLLTVVGVLAGCVSREESTPAAAAPPTVPLSDLAGLVLAVGDQKGGTEALLRSAGQLDDLPYRIDFSTFTSGPPQIEAATAGRIDFAITGNTPPIFGAASNAKVKVVSTYDGGGAGDQILVRNDAAIRSVGDLRGKSVALAKGSSAHGHVLAQLDRAGLSPSDVSLVFLQPADALTAFTQGRVDAWATWDPYTAQAERQLPVRSIADADGVTNGAGFGIASDVALADPLRNTALSGLPRPAATGGSPGWANDRRIRTDVAPTRQLPLRRRSSPRRTPRRSKSCPTAFAHRPVATWPRSPAPPTDSGTRGCSPPPAPGARTPG
ncbi:ABC transporter substrate-binding protein [Mycolicibacterium sediminis]|uniref:Putative aliphatic sulfonates-binding protein n=1 Tax=Mycolicibacterium sediminis TaxID=1286180 RepID=A0A7I7QVQ4_9MYCO|nr:ABC transporter substrate-binding protein [Mycolicibacterium sediminis]